MRPPLVVSTLSTPMTLVTLIPPFIVCSSALTCRGTRKLQFTDQLRCERPQFCGPSAWMVPLVTIFTSFTSDSASSRLESCAMTRASNAISWRSSPITSIPPFFPDTLSCPLTSGSVVLRNSQTRASWPNQLLLLLPSSPPHGPVVNDCAGTRPAKSKAERSNTAYLGIDTSWEGTCQMDTQGRSVRFPKRAPL